MLHLPSAWRAASVDRSSVGSVGGVYNAPTCSRLSRNCAAACAGGAPKSGRDAVLDLASSVGGIALAISAEEACRRFELPADRIGDVVVLSDRHKVIGTAATRHDLSGLTKPLRSHGGLTEQTVPMIVNRPVRMAEGRTLRNFDAFDVALDLTAPDA